jgi:hypothetical protein
VFEISIDDSFVIPLVSKSYIADSYLMSYHARLSLRAIVTLLCVVPCLGALSAPDEANDSFHFAGAQNSSLRRVERQSLCSATKVACLGGPGRPAWQWTPCCSSGDVCYPMSSPLRAFTCMAQCPSGRRVRKEIMDLQTWEMNLYGYAIFKMRTTIGQNGKSIYENFVQSHMDFALQGHQGAYFLPWHRQLLYEFETQLQRFAPVSIPFWDWTKPLPFSSLMVNQIFTRDPALKRFGGSSGRNIPGSPFKNFWTTIPSSHSIQRTFTMGGTAPFAFVSRSNLDVATRSTKSNFDTFSNYLESMHGSPHVAIGGDMGMVTQSPNDPLFWSHHAFVDKIWREWQVQGGNGNRFDGIHNNPKRYVCLDCEPLRPFGRTVRQILLGISNCVTYQETSTRSPLFKPSARTLVDTNVRQAAAMSVSGCFQLDSEVQKKKVLYEIATQKIEDPCTYRQKVLNASKVRASSIYATSFSNLPQYIVDSGLKSFDTIQLLLKVNVNDTKSVAKMTDVEIKQQGQHEKRLISGE